MNWVCFERDHLWYPGKFRRAWSRQFRAGMVMMLPRVTAHEFVARQIARPATVEEIEAMRRRGDVRR